MTGSTTRWGRSPAAARRATTATVAAEASIPVFTAATGRSCRTASICRSTKAGSMTRTPRTAVLFWAVTAVTTLVPKTPRAANVFRSAWIPAPPPESEPAMVRATGGFTPTPSVRVVEADRARLWTGRLGQAPAGDAAGPAGLVAGHHGMAHGRGHGHR